MLAEKQEKGIKFDKRKDLVLMDKRNFQSLNDQNINLHYFKKIYSTLFRESEMAKTINACRVCKRP